MRLALGTVQFGLPYGIANVSGRVSEEEGRRILDSARQAGIDTLDTAIAYGDSEAALGRMGIPDWRVVSKLPAMPDGIGDVRAWVACELNASLKRLNVDQLDGLLLHRPSQLFEPQGQALLSALQEVQDTGLVRKVGVSVYGPEEVDALFKLAHFDIVQAPMNILDRRLVDSGCLHRLKVAGVEVHTRSVFLQGLLLMTSAQRSVKFDRWHGIWHEWSRWLAETEMTALEACLGYALSNAAVDRVLVGVDGDDQLNEILRAIAAAPVLPSLPHFGEVVDNELINPALWNQL